MGFERVAYRGLETGSRAAASYVVSNGKVTFVLTSPLRGTTPKPELSEEDNAFLQEIHKHQERHGDAVKGLLDAKLVHSPHNSNFDADVAFDVDNLDLMFAKVVERGAEVISPPEVLEDEYGCVKLATIRTYRDTTHTLVERSQYRGPFLPGYRVESFRDPISKLLPPVGLDIIDHCVGNVDWDEMEKACA
jgi:4-hydroxyphenylpyruvate dioxygenase